MYVGGGWVGGELAIFSIFLALARKIFENGELIIDDDRGLSRRQILFELRKVSSPTSELLACKPAQEDRKEGRICILWKKEELL